MQEMKDEIPPVKRVNRRNNTSIVSVLFYFCYLLLVIVCIVAATVSWDKYSLKENPMTYKIGTVSIPSLSTVNKDVRFLLNKGTIGGDGLYLGLKYEYKNIENSTTTLTDDIKIYIDLLKSDYGAELLEISNDKNSVKLQMPTKTDDKKIEMTISFNDGKYFVDLQEVLMKIDKPIVEEPKNKISEEQAKEILLSLTKKETNFRAEISVYTVELLPEPVIIDGWKYYVFDVIADYSATRKEHRGTFYVSCDDGMILRYNKDTGGTSFVKEGL